MFSITIFGPLFCFRFSSAINNDVYDSELRRWKHQPIVLNAYRKCSRLPTVFIISHFFCTCTYACCHCCCSYWWNRYEILVYATRIMNNYRLKNVIRNITRTGNDELNQTKPDFFLKNAILNAIAMYSMYVILL